MNNKVKGEVDLFLDSGAHSFYMKAMLKHVTLSDGEYDTYFKDYMSFVKENEGLFAAYVNLDVINDPEKSYKHYLKMTKKGFAPIAVVHPGEDPIWLRKYLDLGCEYLGLGGLGQFFTREKYVSWADRCWLDYLTDKDGMPLVKVHGFAMTSFRLMFRYPWYSVDSTSWVLTGRFGSVYVPVWDDKTESYDYTKEPFKVAVSSVSPKSKDKDQHITSYADLNKKVFEKYFKDNGYKLGQSDFKTVNNYKKYELKENEKWGAKPDGDRRDVEIIVEPGLCNDYKLRDEMNILYFLNLEKGFPKWPWPFKVDTKKSKGLGLS